MTYQEWLNFIKTENAYRRQCHLKNIWNIKGFTIVDKVGHAVEHCGYSLLQKALELADLSQSGTIKQTVYFPYPVGYHECVETTDDDQIIYLKRRGRRNASRFVLNKTPEACCSVHLILKIKDTTVKIASAWVGIESQPEPSSQLADENSAMFWKNHALIAPKGITQSIQNGFEQCWPKKFRHLVSPNM